MMDDLGKKDESGELSPACSCCQDPFADLPPELRPRHVPSTWGLRQVICSGCGLKYWTNRAINVCMECEKKGLGSLATDAEKGN